MNAKLQRRLRVSRALWITALVLGSGLAPVPAPADTPGLNLGESAPADVAPDALAVTEPGTIQADATLVAGTEMPADAKLVSDPKALTALLADRTVHAAYALNGEPWREFSASDGRTIWDAEGCIRPGTWQISGSVVCYIYPTFDDGRPQCFLVYQSAKAVHFVGFKPGTLGRYLVSNAHEILDGNPDGLPLDATQPICGDPNV